MFFAKWDKEGEVDLKSELEQLIILTASRCLLGQEVRNNNLDSVSRLFHDLDNGMLPISIMFPYLPIPAHNRRDRLVFLCAKFQTIVGSPSAGFWDLLLFESIQWTAGLFSSGSYVPAAQECAAMVTSKSTLLRV